MKKIALIIMCVLLLAMPVFANGSQEKEKEPLKFWEHFETFSKMNAALFESFTNKTGIQVEYTLVTPDKMQDSMFVAFRSGSLPDIMSMPSGPSNNPQIFSEGWFLPLTVDKSYFSQEIQDQLFEGLSLYQGKVYSLPLFSQNHSALVFYHPSMVEKAPRSYEEFYQACKKVYEDSNGKVYGLVLPMGFTSRMDLTFEYLMDAAGAPVIDWTTGAYNYASKQMFEFFSLLTKMWDEGLIMPSSVNFNMKEARERWAAGEAAFMIDGIWNVGITKKNFMPDLNDFAVTDVITPTGGDYMVYVNPSEGVYYISTNSKYQQEATDIMLEMISEDYQTEIAKVMDQPPFNLSVLEKAGVHSTYIDCVNIFKKTIGTKPFPSLRNPAVIEVTSNMRRVTPTPAEILQGYFSGAIKDWQTALKTYNQQITEERDLAISKAQAKGLSVSVADWKFDNFVYGESFTTDKY